MNDKLVNKLARKLAKACLEQNPDSAKGSHDIIDVPDLNVMILVSTGQAATEARQGLDEAKALLAMRPRGNA